MVILRESIDLILKFFILVFFSVFSLVCFYSIWEIYAQEAEAFSVKDIIVCGAMAILSVGCTVLRKQIGFDIEDDNCC